MCALNLVSIGLITVSSKMRLSLHLTKLVHRQMLKYDHHVYLCSFVSVFKFTHRFLAYCFPSVFYIVDRMLGNKMEVSNYTA